MPRSVPSWSRRARSSSRRRLVAGATGLVLVASSVLAVASSAAAAVTADRPPVGGQNKNGIPWADLGDPGAANAPGVALDTMVDDLGGGIPGVRVGKQEYKAPVLDAPRWQVVVLSQANLKLQSNRTYNDSGFAMDSTWTSPQKAQLDNDLRRLRNDPVPATVIITTFDRPGWKAFDPAVKAVADVLQAANITLSPSSVQPVGARGAFSAVVNVNGPQFSPQYKWDADTGRGRMDGLLVYDQYLNYRYVPNDRTSIDTRSTSTCNPDRTDCRADARIGDGDGPGKDTTYFFESKGATGLLVRVFDKVDRYLVDQRSFATGGSPDPAVKDDQQAAALTGYLKGLVKDRPGDLVVLTSFRSPGSGRDLVVSKKVTWKTELDLGLAIATVGGSRDTFNRAVGVAGTDYALVGWVKAATEADNEGAGSQTSGPDARLRAVLTRDQFSLYRPTNTSSELEPSDELPRVAWAAPTGTWAPLDGDVIAYLQGSQQVEDTNLVLTADPRRQYWNDVSLKTGAARDGSAMARLAAAVGSVPVPDVTGQKFTRDEFVQTQRQLHDEMVLVAHVRANLDLLAKPLDAVKGDYQNRINKVVDQIYSDSKSKNAAKFDWEGLFGALVSIVGALGPGVLVKVLGVTVETAQKLATALSAMAGIVQASAWGAAHSKAGPPAWDTFSLKRDEIAAYIGNTTDASIANLGIMGDLIVADPSKLKQVGDWCFESAKPEGVCGARDQHWTATATGALKRSNDRTVTTQMAPLAYARYELGPTYWTLVDPTHPLDHYYCGARASFSEAPARAVAVLRQGDYVPHYYQYLQPRDPLPETQTWTWWPTEQVYVMGLIEKFSPQWSGEDYPSQQVLDRMFGPVLVDANADNGGLGIPPSFITTLPPNYDNGCGWEGQYGGGHTPNSGPGYP